MLNARSCVLTKLGETLSEVDIDTLVDTLVERQARMQIKSLENTQAKKEKAALLDKLAARVSEV